MPMQGTPGPSLTLQGQVGFPLLEQYLLLRGIVSAYRFNRCGLGRILPPSCLGRPEAARRCRPETGHHMAYRPAVAASLEHVGGLVIGRVREAAASRSEPK